jgi:hypothetical protein
MLMSAVENTNRPQGVVVRVGRLASDEAAPGDREEGAGICCKINVFNEKLKLFSAAGRPAGPTTNTARLSPRYVGQPEAATAVIELLMMGGKRPKHVEL